MNIFGNQIKQLKRYSKFIIIFFPKNLLINAANSITYLEQERDRYRDATKYWHDAFINVSKDVDDINKKLIGD